VSAKKIHKPPLGKTSTTAPAVSKSGLKPWMQDVIACVVIFFAVLVMFNQIALNGKYFSRGDDTESSAAMNEFARKESVAREYPMWCPYILGGFPSLAAGAYSNYEHMGMPYALANRYLSPRYWADFISIRFLFFDGMNPAADSARWYLSIFLYGGLLMYLLMRRLGFGVLIGLLGALLMALNPYLVSLATAAHGGKMLTFVYMPLILLATWNVIEKRRLFDFSVLALAMGWQIAVGGHAGDLLQLRNDRNSLYRLGRHGAPRESLSEGACSSRLYCRGDNSRSGGRCALVYTSGQICFLLHSRCGPRYRRRGSLHRLFACRCHQLVFGSA